MEVDLRPKTDVCVRALTADFTRLYFNVVCLLFHCWCHAVVIICLANNSPSERQISYVVSGDF